MKYRYDTPEGIFLLDTTLDQTLLSRTTAGGTRRGRIMVHKTEKGTIIFYDLIESAWSGEPTLTKVFTINKGPNGQRIPRQEISKWYMSYFLSSVGT